MKLATAQERERFSDEIAMENLRRMWWLSLFTGALSVAVFLINTFMVRIEMISLGAIDITLTVVLLTLIAFARRPEVRPLWRSGLVLIYIILWLVVLDGYFFEGASYVGHNSSYVLGVISAGVILLQPPALFLPLLLVNHAVYCVLLLASARGGNFVDASLVDGTCGVLIAAVASWFLYKARKSNFRKERVIAQRNRELAASNRELQERAEEMDELMAVAAHDLRGPLESQQNLLLLARDRPNWQPGQLVEVIDTAAQSCRSMLGLVGRLLEAHRAESLGQHPALQRTDLLPIARDATARATPGAAAKDIRLTNILPSSPFPATVHPDYLAEILDNLLGNAIKFSPPGSTVTLALATVDAAPCLEIHDEGPGIPSDEIPQLFRKFHRGPNRPTGGESSSGMGLFIVRKLTEAMRGSVHYLPHSPSGSTFRLVLAP